MALPQMERLEREMADVAEAEATAAAVNDMFGPVTAERLVREAGLERDDALMAELSDRINVRPSLPHSPPHPLVYLVTPSRFQLEQTHRHKQLSLSVSTTI